MKNLMTWHCFLIYLKTLFLLLYLSVSLIYGQSSIKWPNGAKAAICLTYDDAMETHLNNAIPQLDSMGLKGTFFLYLFEGKFAKSWKKAAQNGHELGNHTLFHPCKYKEGKDFESSIDAYSVERILDEISVMNGILRQIDPKRPFRTFAVPCRDTQAGGKDYLEPLKKSGLIKYARLGKAGLPIVSEFKELDLMRVPAWGVLERYNSEEIINFAQKAKEVGGLAVYTFHGIGGQWISTDNEKHRALLTYLKANQKDFWVAPFGEAMEWIEKHR